MHRAFTRFATGLLLLLSTAALAQAWPAKTVRIVVPFAAGGPADIYARAVGESLIPDKPFALPRDFVPVAPLNYSDLQMFVHPSVPASTVKEFVALAKAQPGKLKALGSTGKARSSVLPDVPEMREAWARQGATAMSMTTEEFGRFLRGDINKWARIVKISGARADR